MQIAVDAREGYKQKKAGKGQWARKVIEELQTRADVELQLFVTELEADAVSTLPNVTILPAGWRYFFALRKELRKHKINTLLSPTSFLAALFAPFGTHILQVIHDCIAWRREPHQFKAKWMERLLFPLLLLCRPTLLCNSETTKYDLLELFPKVGN